jgi:hypothetical protein
MINIYYFLTIYIIKKMNEKIKNQLFKKNIFYKYDEENKLYSIYVPCKRVGQTNEVVFDCPFCYDKYKKCGEPFKNSISVKHFHGYTPDASGNIGSRTPHCSWESRRYWDLPNFEFYLFDKFLITAGNSPSTPPVNLADL